MHALLCQLWVMEMPECSIHIWAEAQQGHEKVQGPCNECSEGETNPQAHEGCISLELQEEQAQEAPWQLAARLSEGLIR